MPNVFGETIDNATRRVRIEEIHFRSYNASEEFIVEMSGRTNTHSDLKCASLEDQIQKSQHDDRISVQVLGAL